MESSRDELLYQQALIASDPWDGRPSREAWFVEKLRSRYPALPIHDLSPILDELRLIKSERELSLIRKASQIAAWALIQAIKSTRPGVREYQLDAAARYVFLTNGAKHAAYPAIVGGGTNAWQGHCYRNADPLKANDMVLMDFAPDYRYYTSDITRWWPVNGKYNSDQKAFAKFRPIVSPTWEFPDQNFDRHSYQKAALVIRLPRSVRGDAAYRRAVTHFLQKHAYRSADTQDLLVAIRESTGQALDDFFDAWLYQPGHPVLSIESRWLEAEKVLEIRVAPTQQGNGQPLVFPMPLQFGIATASGLRVERVWMQQRAQTLRFSVTGKPLVVRFDEGNELLCEFDFPKSTDELLYQLEHDDVTGRIWAAGQLAKRTHESEVLPALQRSAGSDPFWGVRREALRATAEAGTAGITAFWHQRAVDAKSAVRVAALQLLASRRDPTLRTWFLERYRTDDSYLAQAEALRALGGCGTTEDLAILRNAATQPSPATSSARPLWTR